MIFLPYNETLILFSRKNFLRKKINLQNFRMWFWYFWTFSPFLNHMQMFNNFRIVPLKYLIVFFILFFFINFVDGNNRNYMIKVKLYILSVLLLLVSCTGNKVIDEQITRADSLMEANSDSALVALGMLDSLRENNPKMSKAQQMRFDLIYAKGMNKGFVDFTTDSVMKQVVAYYDKHGSANERMLAYYLLGCTYRDLDDSPASLDCYLQATEQADTLSRDCDYHTLARIYGQVGDAYLRQKMPLNAKNAYRKNEKYSWIAKDTLEALIAAEAQVNSSIMLESPSQVIEQCLDVYNNYKKFGYPTEAARSLGVPMSSLILTKQYAKVKRYMDIYERESGYFDGKLNPSVNYNYYFYAKGLYYLNIHSDSAKMCFLKCSNLAKSVIAKRLAFDGWYRYYKQKNLVDSIKMYADLFIQYSDSVRIQNEVEAMSKTSALYNYSQWQKKAKVQEIENNRAHIVIFLMIVLVIVLIIVVVLYVKNLRKERQIRKEQLLFVKQQIMMKELELQKSQEELAKMKNELSSKSSLVLDKEKSIMMLKDEIEALTNDCPQDNNESYAMFQQKAMVIKFRELAEKGIEPSSQQWDVLDNIFESFFKQFRLSLEKNSKLNENEYRICMLVWLGFAPNQMKVLMGMSSSNISNIRKRLSKKLFDREMTTSKFDDEIRKIRVEA